MKHFTGKDEYHFGDISKNIISKFTKKPPVELPDATPINPRTTPELSPRTSPQSAPRSTPEMSVLSSSTNKKKDFPFCNWMEQIKDIISRKPLRDLFIPGSHDSISYSFTATSPFSAELEKVIPLQPFKLYHPLTCAIAKTQSDDLYRQLEIGSRYFDLRFQYSFEKKCFFGHHGLLGLEASELFTQILNFSKKYPMEIIILRFSHFLNFDHEIHLKFQLLIEKFFEDKILFSPNPLSLTPSHFWNEKKQFLVFYQSTKLRKKFLPLNLFLDSNPWANTPNQSELYLKLYSKVKHLQASRFFILQAILTGNSSMVLDKMNILSPNSSMSVYSLTVQLRSSLLKWLEEWKNYKLNIIMVDFITPDLVRFCFEQNKKVQLRKMKNISFGDVAELEKKEGSSLPLENISLKNKEKNDENNNNIEKKINLETSKLILEKKNLARPETELFDSKEISLEENNGIVDWGLRPNSFLSLEEQKEGENWGFINEKLVVDKVDEKVLSQKVGFEE